MRCGLAGRTANSAQIVSTLYGRLLHEPPILPSHTNLLCFGVLLLRCASLSGTMSAWQVTTARSLFLGKSGKL